MVHQPRHVAIEKGIPVSQFYLDRYLKIIKKEHKGGRDATYIYPFDKMEPGDSFLIPPHSKPSLMAHRVTDVRRTAKKMSEEGKEFVVIRDDTHKYRCYRLT